MPLADTDLAAMIKVGGQGGYIFSHLIIYHHSRRQQRHYNNNSRRLPGINHERNCSLIPIVTSVLRVPPDNQISENRIKKHVFTMLGRIHTSAQ